jgi:hypothetical protein
MSDSTLHPAHPDVELLADHAEELLTLEQSAELTAHLASCAECRETYDALGELAALLGEEPSPGPMPDDVAARIDAALAAERASGSQPLAGSPSVADREAERDAEREQVPAHATTEAPDAAAAQAAEGSGEGSGAGSAEGDGEEGDGEEGDGADRARSRRRPAGDRPGDNRPGNRSSRSARMRRVLATLAIFVAAGGIGIAVSRGGDLDSGTTSGANSRGATVTAPSPKAAAAPAYAFTQSNLATEVQRLASDSARLHAGHTVGTVPSTSTSPAATPSGPSSTATASSGVGALVTPNGGHENAEPSPAQPTAPTCVLAATKQTQLPAVQGLGSYLDVQVFALLYPDPTDPAHTWDVYLVQNSCAAPLVMLHASVPRG